MCSSLPSKTGQTSLSSVSSSPFTVTVMPQSRWTPRAFPNFRGGLGASASSAAHSASCPSSSCCSGETVAAGGAGVCTAPGCCAARCCWRRASRGRRLRRLIMQLLKDESQAKNGKSRVEEQRPSETEPPAFAVAPIVFAHLVFERCYGELHGHERRG